MSKWEIEVRSPRASTEARASERPCSPQGFGRRLDDGLWRRQKRVEGVLSQELEHRLRETFSEDDLGVQLYGNETNAAVVNLIGAMIRSASTRDSAKRKYDWLGDQFLFDDVMAAIRHVLLWFRPGGDSGLREITGGSGIDRANRLIDEIRSADPSLPITKGSARQHTMARLREKLANLVSARNPYDDFRRPKPAEPRNISNRCKREQRKRK